MRWNPQRTNRRVGAIALLGVAVIGTGVGTGIGHLYAPEPTTHEAGPCVQYRASELLEQMGLVDVEVLVADRNSGKAPAWVTDGDLSTIKLGPAVAAQCEGLVGDVDEFLDNIAHEAVHIAQNRLLSITGRSEADLEAALGGERNGVKAIEYSASCGAYTVGRVNTPAGIYGAGCSADDLANAAAVLAGQWPTIPDPAEPTDNRMYATPTVGAGVMGDDPSVEVVWVRQHGLDVAVNARGERMVVDPASVPAGWALMAES